MLDIKMCAIQDSLPIRWLGCSIEQQPNNLIIGDSVISVKQPNQPNNLIIDLPTTNHNTTHLDVINIEPSATDKNIFITEREKLLNNLRKKQPFRVAVGKSTWTPYESFSEFYNLREILDDEAVIEFDTSDLEIVVRAISETCFNLMKAGITFQYWNHGGKSPHLHIHDLPIAHLEPDKRKLFKQMFIKKYVPQEFHKYVDLSLCGVHLIAIEWAQHWKGCYDVKKLIHTFTPEQYREAQHDQL